MKKNGPRRLRKVRITITVVPDVWHAARALAVRKGYKISHLIEQAIRKELETP